MPILGSAAGALDFSGVTLPFTVNQMMVAGMSLVGLIAAFVLLNLAFQFVPKITGMILASFRGGGKKA